MDENVTINHFNLAELLRELTEKAYSAKKKAYKLEPKVQVITGLAKNIEKPDIIKEGAFEYNGDIVTINLRGRLDCIPYIDNPLIEIFNAVQQKFYTMVTVAEKMELIRTVPTVDQVDLAAEIPAILMPITFTPLNPVYNEEIGITKMALRARSHDFDDDFNLDIDSFIENVKFTIENYLKGELIDSIDRFLEDDNGYILYHYLVEERLKPAQEKVAKIERISPNIKPMAYQKEETKAKADRENARIEIKSSLKNFIEIQLKMESPLSKLTLDQAKKVPEGVSLKDLFYTLSPDKVYQLLQIPT